MLGKNIKSKYDMEYCIKSKFMVFSFSISDDDERQQITYNVEVQFFLYSLFTHLHGSNVKTPKKWKNQKLFVYTALNCIQHTIFHSLIFLIQRYGGHLAVHIERGVFLSMVFLYRACVSDKCWTLYEFGYFAYMQINEMFSMLLHVFSVQRLSFSTFRSFSGYLVFCCCWW